VLNHSTTRRTHGRHAGQSIRRGPTRSGCSPACDIAKYTGLHPRGPDDAPGELPASSAHPHRDHDRGARRRQGSTLTHLGSLPTRTTRGRLFVLCTARLSNDELYRELKADQAASRRNGVEALYLIGGRRSPRMMSTRSRRPPARPRDRQPESRPAAPLSVSGDCGGRGQQDLKREKLQDAPQLRHDTDAELGRARTGLPLRQPERSSTSSVDSGSSIFHPAWPEVLRRRSTS